MDPKDRDLTKGGERRDKAEPRREEPNAPERESAPPIEREHETYAGVLEEDERREREGR